MKKTLLSLAIVLFAFTIYGQEYVVKQEIPVNISPNNGGHKTFIGQKASNLLNTAIGTTWYDLQGYNNIGQRIYEYPDGTIATIWQSAGENLIPNRGTGYNYFDGNSWGEPLAHLGDDERTGWPTYAPWGPTGEIIMHYWYPGGQQGPLKFYRREVKGEGDWIETELMGPDGLSLVWASIITSGEDNDFIHVLAYTYDAPYLGQDNAVLYYRSSDGAETWEIEHELIEGMGIDYYPSGQNFTYSWAQPQDENLAFVYGPTVWDGKVFKSYNNGDSWENILFYEAPFTEVPPAASDLFGCGDGKSAIALDSDGNAHVVFTKMINGFTDDGGQVYVPNTEGIIYWREGMEVMDSTFISSYTNQFIEDAGQLIGYMLPDPITGTYDLLDEQFSYQTGRTSRPQMGIDANDNMFVTYEALSPGFDNIVNNYRHIHVNSSWDGGSTWNGPIDINTDVFFIFSECVYPAMSPVIDEKIHIIFQEDNQPGIHEWLDNHGANENTMKHMEFDKDLFVDIKNNKPLNQGIVVSACYPNPAVNNTQFTIRLDKPAAVSISISNMMGQTVAEISQGVLNAGNNPVNVQLSNLTSGVYYCTVQADNQKTTQKLIVR